MNALLLIAHGSRKASSNQEIADLAHKIKGQEHNFDLVEHAFLELTDPKVPHAIDALVEHGAKHITLMPYFLAAGMHVTEDLPELLDEAKKQYGNVEFKLLTHLGAAEQMPQWILGFASES